MSLLCNRWKRKQRLRTSQHLSLQHPVDWFKLCPGKLQVLARDYQQQLFFPFRLSSQHYSQRGTQLAASLAPLLHNEQLAAFMQAMDNVTYPSQRWEAWHAQLQQLVGKGKEVGREGSVALHAIQEPTLVQCWGASVEC